MAVDSTIRQITRDKLFAILKSEELVRLFESLITSLRVSVPTDIAGVQGSVDTHIAKVTGAHQASAIGSTPAGGITANSVQGALNELDTKKQATNAVLTALIGATTASVLIGRGSLGGAGAAQEITLGTGLTMTGTTLSAAGGSGSGDVTGPAGATNLALVLFDGTTGKLLKDSLATIDADASLAANSDARIPTQKAVRTYTARYSRSFLLMGA